MQHVRTQKNLGMHSGENSYDILVYDILSVVNGCQSFGET